MKTKKCKQCPGKQQADLEENLMALAYLDFVGLNKAAEKGTKIHQEMEIKGVETGTNRDRPYDGQDPWEFKREEIPTHMKF